MRPSIARDNGQVDVRGIPDADIPRPSQLQLIDPTYATDILFGDGWQRTTNPRNRLGL